MATETLQAEPEAQPDVTTQPDPDTTQADVGGTPETTPKPFDPASIAPEVKSHFEKQYDGFSKYKEMAAEYENLLRAPQFQEWYRGLNQPKTDKFEVTDEQFVQALSNKDQFASLVNSLAEKVAKEKFGPQIEQVQMQANLANKSNELNRVLTKYPDFQEMVDQRGLLEGYIQKYPNLGFEEIYKLAKWDNFNTEVDKRARGLVDSKKAASVEKPGTTSGAKSRKVKAKSSLEAMEIAAEAFKAGREAPDIDFE